MNKYKLVMFDMDGTILKDRGIFVIAKKLGFYNELFSYFKNKNCKNQTPRCSLKKLFLYSIMMTE